MRSFVFKICAFAFVSFNLSLALFGQTKPLYRLPESLPERSAAGSDNNFLVGTENGLYRVLPTGLAEPLWTEGGVERILKTSARWYFVTEKGIVSSADLKTFTECNNGIPFLTIKNYDGKNKNLVKKAPLLKDIAADPFNPDILVTATKDAVYLSRDGAKNWKSIGSMSTGTAGMKAVAVSHMPVYSSGGTESGTELVVFMSHPIYGLSYYRADAARPSWQDVSAGFAAMPSLTQPDEIADIIPVVTKREDGSVGTEIYLSQSFMPNIYRFDWRNKRAIKIYEGSLPCDTIDGLCQTPEGIAYSTPGKVRQFLFADGKMADIDGFENWRLLLNAPRSLVNSAYVPASLSGTGSALTLSELWLLNPDMPLTPWGLRADKKKAIYVSAYQMRNMEGIQKYRRIISQNKLNSLVIDMKDDYGLLRFEPQSALLKQKGKSTQYKIDLDTFTREFKQDGTYLIARIVVFKDKNLAAYGKKQYAVWDDATNSPWVGIRGTEDVTDEEGNVTGTKTAYYDENWVDPYSEEVWEYNVEIAQELIRRGFDEIQFDYIRFPTDGTNLRRAKYRWRDSGMDKESALVSFLAYARDNINAPIGIDIYGANGWYRSGTRTGQDVELMSDYVDVICPMFYPSHFEQDFLEYPPVKERPYRIYFYGSYRNTVIGRNHILVRPWVQAFYMGVRYDRQHYDKNYVLREIFGVRDGVDHGYMHWNNSGKNYEDISPDPQDDEVSPWAAYEADLQKRLPAFSSGKKDSTNAPQNADSEKERNEAMISILNTVLEPELSDAASVPVNLLRIEPFGAVHD